MPIELFTKLIPLVDADPFALLGVSVGANEKQIARRYRQIAKQLHPDALLQNSTAADQVLATEAIARIVNPAYQQLKHEKSRQAALINLRLRMRRLARTEKLAPTFESVQQLAQVSNEAINSFYEQALAQLAASQFQPLDSPTQFLELDQLNLIFLHRQLALVALPNPTEPNATETVPTPITAVIPDAVSTQAPPVDYATKHVVRAKTYLAQHSYDKAVQELREALKITPRDAEIHALIGQAYYKQDLLGMAKAHFRQTLRLNPTHRTAKKYGQLLGLSDSVAETAPKKPWLGRLLHR